MQEGLPIACILQIVAEVVVGDLRAVHPLIEEPVHWSAKMLFDDALKIFGGGVLCGVGGNEIAHHRDETPVGIGRAGVLHHGSEHLQHVGTLAVDEPPGVPAFQVGVRLIGQRYRANVNDPVSRRVL